MTRERLRGESIYRVFIRNYSEKGDFKGLIQDLDRLVDLGITVLSLYPHYPIGIKNRRGDLGSPYSIQDYYAVDPELGGLNDFKALLDEAHNKGLKIIIDIVYHHTSCDSELLTEHPEFFHKDNNGNFISKIPAWTDVYDLDFDNIHLRDSLVENLHYWADLGIDGFRAATASIVPLSFWQMAKDRLQNDYPDLIWLAESVEKEFISFIRNMGFPCHSDSELYNVFDIVYDYDVYKVQLGYIERRIPFKAFVVEKQDQEVIYPQDYLKLRFIDADKLEDSYEKRNWRAFAILENGIPLIRNGEEVDLNKHLDLEDEDKINWKREDTDYSNFVQKLLGINSGEMVKFGIYTINSLHKHVVHIRYRYKGETLHGILNFDNALKEIPIDVLEGEFTNLITDKSFKITDKTLDLTHAPYVFTSIP